jgi:hypothetical protein
MRILLRGAFHPLSARDMPILDSQDAQFNDLDVGLLEKTAS